MSDRAPACCSNADAAFREGAIVWRDAVPAHRFSDLLEGPPFPLVHERFDLSTVAGRNSARFYAVAAAQEPMVPATPASYRMVVDFCPETDGNAESIFGDVRFCPFCGREGFR